MIETLAAAGVERVYGVVWDSLNGFSDSLRRSGKIQWVHMRHEEGAAFAAAAAVFAATVERALRPVPLEVDGLVGVAPLAPSRWKAPCPVSMARMPACAASMQCGISSEST